MISALILVNKGVDEPNYNFETKTDMCRPYIFGKKHMMFEIP